MSKSFTKQGLQLPSVRRVCRIVADEHGKASAEWIDAPPDYSCPTVELKGVEAGLSLEPEASEGSEDAYDPYSNPTAGPRKRTKRKRVNLRQLSDWIKKTRDVKQTTPVASDDD